MSLSLSLHTHTHTHSHTHTHTHTLTHTHTHTHTHSQINFFEKQNRPRSSQTQLTHSKGKKMSHKWLRAVVPVRSFHRLHYSHPYLLPRHHILQLRRSSSFLSCSPRYNEHFPVVYFSFTALLASQMRQHHQRLRWMCGRKHNKHNYIHQRTRMHHTHTQHPIIFPAFSRMFRSMYGHSVCTHTRSSSNSCAPSLTHCVRKGFHSSVQLHCKCVCNRC